MVRSVLRGPTVTCDICEDRVFEARRQCVMLSQSVPGGLERVTRQWCWWCQPCNYDLCYACTGEETEAEKKSKANGRGSFNVREFAYRPEEHRPKVETPAPPFPLLLLLILPILPPLPPILFRGIYRDARSSDG
eukprot:1405060-Rhodomonas_salina.2